MIKKVFVDMDGVLANFHDRYRSLYSQEPRENYISKNKEKDEYRKNFKEFIDNQNFSTLDLMPDAILGLGFLNKLSESLPIYILSSTASHELWEQLAKQKKYWLDVYNINYSPIFVPGKRYKQMYSGPGNVLIDDSIQNIEQWDEKGGIGIFHKSWMESIEIYNNIK